MVKWRYYLILTVLLLLPLEIGSKSDYDEDDEQRLEEEGNDEENDEEDDEEEPASKVESVDRTAPAPLTQTTHVVPVTRTTKKIPLECYTCAHKPDSVLRACLDPTKYRVQTITCHNADDKCFTSVISKGSTFEVMRGCRSGCIGSSDIKCCDLNRCNNQPYAMPAMLKARALIQTSKATKTSFPSSVLFFVTILLVLQTVVKVTFV